MIRCIRYVILPAALLISGCRSAGRLPEPPVARAVPTQLEAHGHVRVDPYYWLKERDNPEVLKYLEDENEYTESVMAHTRELQETLFAEIKGRIKETDMSVPYRRGGYFYYSRDEEGREYPIYCRKQGGLEASEEILLDVNALAEGHGYFSVVGLAVSPGEQLLAFGVDTVGRRFYDLRFKNLATGEMLPDLLPRATANVAWLDDGTVFYTRQEPTTLRWHRVYRHRLGSPPERDSLVYEETDETFNCSVQRTKSDRYLFIGSFQTLASEYRYLATDRPRDSFRVFVPRQRDHEYFVDHQGDHFFIRTNQGAKNFRLMKTPVNRTARDHWVEVRPHRSDVLLEGFQLFTDFLVLRERRNGLSELHVLPHGQPGAHQIDFGEPAYQVYPSHNFVMDSPILRYRYESLTTPESVFDYDMRTRTPTLLKRKEVLGGFDPRDYHAERLYATAADGARIPVSLVHRKGLARDGRSPLLLYGYGSYGYSIDASFQSDRLSLLDRGFTFAIAHVRGGEELGRWWYEDGKLLKKKNTFTDFIACAEHLIEWGYTSPDRLFARGGSAGGLLMGAVANMRPDLFRGIVADVPFVDLMTTMLDETIPLTTAEYDEWGDPNDSVYYGYMLSYSPYDQVAAQAYPHLLVLTGLHDSQVQYWEPAKWVAKLRALKTDSNRLLLKTEMQAGHGGVSGRYRQFRETAFWQAFVLDLAGRGL